MRFASFYFFRFKFSLIKDPREIFLKNISLKKSIIDFNPSIVLLFGGEVNIKETYPTSIRGMLLDYCVGNNESLYNTFKLVEHYKNWLHDGHYCNLLTFEEDLSQLASLVVIILESYGAVAELGAFIVNEKIKNKLVIVLTDKHAEAKSFITLGLLSHLNEEVILAYDWDYKDIKETAKNELPILSKDIEKIIKNRKIEHVNINNSGHIAYIIHELIILFKALTSKEIYDFLKQLKLNIEIKTVKKCLYLLYLLDLTKSRRKGNRQFFIAKCDISRVAFSYSKYNKSFRNDESEFKLSLIRYYAETEKEQIRYKIISEEYKKTENDI